MDLLNINNPGAWNLTQLRLLAAALNGVLNFFKNDMGAMAMAFGHGLTFNISSDYYAPRLYDGQAGYHSISGNITFYGSLWDFPEEEIIYSMLHEMGHDFDLHGREGEKSPPFTKGKSSKFVGTIWNADFCVENIIYGYCSDPSKTVGTAVNTYALTDTVEDFAATFAMMVVISPNSGLNQCQAPKDAYR